MTILLFHDDIILIQCILMQHLYLSQFVNYKSNTSLVNKHMTRTFCTFTMRHNYNSFVWAGSHIYLPMT